MQRDGVCLHPHRDGCTIPQPLTAHKVINHSDVSTVQHITSQGLIFYDLKNHVLVFRDSVAYSTHVRQSFYTIGIFEVVGSNHFFHWINICSWSWIRFSPVITTRSE